MKSFGVVMFTLLAAASCAPRHSTAPQESVVTSPRPQWLIDTLNSNRLGGIDPALVVAAAADPDHVRAIESAIRSGQPREAFNLRFLLGGLDYREQRPEYLALARRMYQTDPDAHAETLVWIAEYRPIETCEVEVLRIAFMPVDPTGDPDSRRHARHAAASNLTRRLAFDAASLPRPLPQGAPALSLAADTRVECFQRAILLGYGIGDRNTELASLNALLKDPDRRPSNDHEAADCETVAYRIQEGR